MNAAWLRAARISIESPYQILAMWIAFANEVNAPHRDLYPHVGARKNLHHHAGALPPLGFWSDGTEHGR